MNSKRWFGLGFCLMVVLLITGITWAVPGVINYQGKLANLDGAPVVDGTYSIHFRIYNVGSGGTALWEDTQSVAVVDGIYNVKMPADPVGNPFPEDLLNNAILYLGIQVEADSEMAPRQEITSTFYAMKAGDADTLQGLGSDDFALKDHEHSGEDITSGIIPEARIPGSIARDSEITWGNLTGIPSDIADGDDVGISTETDPTVLASVKDGVSWAEIQGMPAGFSDGVDDNSGGDITGVTAGTGLSGGGTVGTVTLDVDIPFSLTNSVAGGLIRAYNDYATIGYGILGNASGSSGRGVYGYAGGTGGTGVYGSAGNSGNVTNFGGSFVAYGLSGRGVYGSGANSGTGANYGGYFTASATSGRGVYGSASNSGGDINYGGYFQARGLRGRGIYATATNTGVGTNYGGYFQASGSSGRGVYGIATGEFGVGVYAYSSAGDGLMANTGASDEHAGYFYTSVGAGLSGAALYARSYNTSNNGIAFWAENAHSTSTDATAVLSNAGSGPLLKGFGGNGGEDEFRFDNDGTLRIYNGSHRQTIVLDPSEVGASDGSQITLYNADGVATIEIDGSYNGDGRVTTQELQITGGSDLSEQFDVSKHLNPVPGMLVSIDPERPGKLCVTTEAYDKKVAGIISGAGGIKPGMMMGQKGTKADGAVAIALTGRVYCMADASHGAIEPGDILTTSDVPGHAMKVTDHARATGAIIGKAMTSLKKGKGLVLVLVTLQ